MIWHQRESWRHDREKAKEFTEEGGTAANSNTSEVNKRLLRCLDSFPSLSNQPFKAEVHPLRTRVCSRVSASQKSMLQWVLLKKVLRFKKSKSLVYSFVKMWTQAYVLENKSPSSVCHFSCSVVTEWWRTNILYNILSRVGGGHLELK